MTEPIGTFCVSCARRPPSPGAYPMRPASVGGTATTTASAVADPPVLLRSPGGPEQRVQQATGVAVEEEVEEGQVGRLAGEHRTDHEAPEVATRGRAHVPAQPRLHGLAVPAVGPFGLPRRIQRD